MSKRPNEWFKQAEYDMKTAEGMFETGRFIYVVFMCHLSIEKALKGIYTQGLNTLPPKTHNLVLLVEKTKLGLPDDLYDFMFKLNGVSVPTRYPEDIAKLKKEYSRKKTELLLKQSKELLRWLKRKLEP